MSLFFPPKSRIFPGQRWVKIALRSLHLVGMAGIGSILFVPEFPFLAGSAKLLVFTGVAIAAIELWSNGVWLIQVRGLAIVLKIILLLLIPSAGGAAQLLLIIVIVISGVISHAPGDVRYYSLFHGRRIDSLP